jgi:hypothetical protein
MNLEAFVSGLVLGEVLPQNLRGRTEEDFGIPQSTCPIYRVFQE